MSGYRRTNYAIVLENDVMKCILISVFCDIMLVTMRTGMIAAILSILCVSDSHSSLNPINVVEGVHRDVIHWIDAMPFDDEQSFNVYTTRLRSLATQVLARLSLQRITPLKSENKRKI